MFNKSNIHSVVPPKDRLFLRLSILFAAGFALFFAGTMVYDAFGQIIEAETPAQNSKAAPDALALDPKIEQQLLSAAAPDDLPSATEVQDPFKDRGGISNNGQVRPAAASQAVNAASRQTPPAPDGSNRKLLAGQMPTGDLSRSNRTDGFPIPGTTTVAPGTVVATPTILRYQAREAEMRAGRAVEPEASVFSIEDLLPVGVVSGGDDEPEIMLYSQSLMRTFSFPPGARFYDGWLAAWTAEGVEFGYAEARGEVRLKTWARSVKPATAQNESATGKTNGKE